MNVDARFTSCNNRMVYAAHIPKRYVTMLNPLGVNHLLKRGFNAWQITIVFL